MPKGTMRPVRVTLFDCGTKSGDPFAPVQIDLIVDDVGKRFGRALGLGWQGYPNNGNRWPFVVTHSGEVDFGSGLSDAADRYGDTNLFQVTIREGQLVNFGARSQSIREYRIEKIHYLDEVPAD